MGGIQNSPGAIPHEGKFLVSGDQEMTRWDLSTAPRCLHHQIKIAGVLPTLAISQPSGCKSPGRPGRWDPRWRRNFSPEVPTALAVQRHSALKFCAVEFASRRI